MPVAGKTVHVIRPKRRGAWCGLDVSPSGARPREERVRARWRRATFQAACVGAKTRSAGGSPILFYMGVPKRCTKTRRWFAKTVALSSCSPPVSRNSTQKRVSRTNRPAAKPAALLAKPAGLPLVHLVRCTMPFALTAVSPLRFLLFLAKIALFIAASASQQCIAHKATAHIVCDFWRAFPFREKPLLFYPLFSMHFPLFLPAWRSQFL